MNKRSHKLISVPGAEEYFGVGDPSRSLRLAANKFTGTWDEWDAKDHDLQMSYDVYEDTGIVEVEGNLCELETRGALKDVPAGEWEATVLLQVEDTKCFRAEWRVGGGESFESKTDWSPQDANLTYDKTSKAMEEETGIRPLLFRVDCDNEKCAGSKTIGLNKVKWVRLSLGIIRLKEKGDVSFTMKLQGNGWVRSIHFGDFELRAAGIELEKERLLLQCLDHKASDQHCALQELPEELIRGVSRFIISPWRSPLAI